MAEAHFSGAVADLRLLNPQNQQHEEGNTGSEGFTSKSLVLDTGYFSVTSYQSVLRGLNYEQLKRLEN